MNNSIVINPQGSSIVINEGSRVPSWVSTFGYVVIGLLVIYVIYLWYLYYKSRGEVK